MESAEQIRRANINDIGGILELIRPLEQQGILVRRSREQLEMEIDKFTIIERDNLVIACAALYPYPEEKLGKWLVSPCILTTVALRGEKNFYIEFPYRLSN